MLQYKIEKHQQDGEVFYSVICCNVATKTYATATEAAQSLPNEPCQFLVRTEVLLDLLCDADGLTKEQLAALKNRPENAAKLFAEVVEEMDTDGWFTFETGGKL